MTVISVESPRIVAADGAPLNAAQVVARLEDAGATLLTMKKRVAPPVKLAAENMKWLVDMARIERIAGGIKPFTPNAGAVSRMDEAYHWLSLIPDQAMIVRRILGARSLVSPKTQRFIYSWRRLGLAINADPRTVQHWHAGGIDFLVSALAAETRKAA